MVNRQNSMEKYYIKFTKVVDGGEGFYLIYYNFVHLFKSCVDGELRENPFLKHYIVVKAKSRADVKTFVETALKPLVDTFVTDDENKLYNYFDVFIKPLCKIEK